MTEMEIIARILMTIFICGTWFYFILYAERTEQELIRLREKIKEAEAEKEEWFHRYCESTEVKK